MPYALYVCLQDEDKIAVFVVDAETGRLTPQTEVPTTGGPSVVSVMSVVFSLSPTTLTSFRFLICVQRGARARGEIERRSLTSLT